MVHCNINVKSIYYIPVHFMIRSTPVAFSRSLGCGGKDMVSTTPFAGCTDPRSRKHPTANIFAILIFKNAANLEINSLKKKKSNQNKMMTSSVMCEQVAA